MAGEDEGQHTGVDDWKAKYEAMREHMREWEKKAKANQEAADKLKQLEEDGKSEVEKANEVE